MDLTTMTNDELTVGLRTWAARIAADNAQLLRLLGEFDRVKRGEPPVRCRVRTG